MQRKTGDEVELGATDSPFHCIGESSAIYRTASSYEDSREKVKQITQLISKGMNDADIARYIPGTLDLAYQGMIENIDTKKKTTHISYKGMEQLDFQIMLTDNYYVNPNSIHLCFSMKIKSDDDSSNIDTDLITVNNFYVTKYSNNKQLIPTF